MSSPPTAPPQPPETRSGGLDEPSPGGGGRGGRLRGALAFLRNTWRGLTSMRTALVLLFLLALAALPGALLPQRSLNQSLVDQYFTDHPTLAPILDTLGAFEVFASTWFAAIYLLLMISLVGCVLPRALEYYRGARAAPVATPRNLARLPHHDEGDVAEDVEAFLARTRTRLRGWRRIERSEPGGVRTVSAERGYLRETGNLVFHLSLIGLLIGFAGGKIYGYEGDVIVLADGSEFCNTSILGYDSFRAGLQVDGTELNPFCVKVDRFDASYLPNGQPSTFSADLGYQSGEDLDAGTTTWRPDTISVNHPLRTGGDRVYLTGYGYSPQFTVTWPDGTTRSGEIQWRPVDRSTQLAEGATKFERPGVTDPVQRTNSQLALTGTFAPTAALDTEGDLASAYPGLRNPVVELNVMRGDLGIDDGRGQSIFTVDQAKVDSGELRSVARADLAPGQTTRLDDGTVVRFDGVGSWVNLQVGHDPGQLWVLVFAVTMVGGLAVSLSIRRRRFWVRVVGSGTGSRVQIGGLARTDRAGYGEEFDRVAAELLRPGHDTDISHGDTQKKDG
ncbi:cytochrome c biogenesis protein ResB [Pseudonocardia sp. KRD291]|uniref:cytochrome c biogenesis protein ResB n=1 Tax=Pseudonocardia sp. KRD291 TaxID=2792007 RepID=UPI001C49E8CE|nr:cytochrome c biogenesis protein ResB [Pseudonocardia sp. KRD291]MBW0103402.1 cytochrome c biogenesis protein ResB [Pseudonocardia sp. KRD291]